MSKRSRRSRKRNSRQNKSGFNNNHNKKNEDNRSPGPKKAEHRIEMEREKRKKQDMIIITSVIVAVLVLAALYILSPLFSPGRNDTGPEPAIESPAPTADNEILIPISDVDDGEAHYYTYDSNGVDIRYFVLKSTDGKIRAAFDTCDVCYGAKKGYHQEGNQMVCNNCGQRFDSTKINEVKGGCNPAPLTRKVEGDKLVINTNDLEKGRWYFE